MLTRPQQLAVPLSPIANAIPGFQDQMVDIAKNVLLPFTKRHMGAMLARHVMHSRPHMRVGVDSKRTVIVYQALKCLWAQMVLSPVVSA